MKKLFIYLIAAVFMLGFASAADAGTVTTVGNTDISIGGFILGYYGESYNQNLVSSMANNPGIVNSNTANTTKFSGTLDFTRLWLNLDNKPNGVTGYISADFNGSGDQGLSSGLRLRRAYLIKSFCLEKDGCGGYVPWIEIGQDYTLGQPVGFSFSAYQNAGLAGDEASVPIWVPQLMAGVKFTSGNATFNPQIGIIDLQGESGSDNYTELMSNAGDTKVYSISASVPGFGVKLPITFKTDFGAPASFYAAFQDQIINVSYGASSADVTKKTNNGFAVSGGLTLPVSYVTFMGDIQYTSGMTGLNTVLGQGAYTPEAYWSENGDNLHTTKALQWDAQAKINFQQFGAPVSVAGGYSQVLFSDYNDAQNLNLGGNYSAWQPYNTTNNVSPVRMSGSIFANIAWNMTKSVMLGLEWDNNKTTYTVDPDESFASNAVYAVGMYSF
ncbi:MAG: hypothetical protein ACYCSW_11470 [bacterium]